MRKIRVNRILWKILRPVVIVFLYIKFGYTYKKARNLPDKFIVLSNHNTDFDPIFLGVSFPDFLHYVASEHISRWKNGFKIINFIFNPILRPKGTVAASTVKEILRSVRGGNNVCLFAEGARSWNGVTAPILPSTGKLVKSSQCALVTYKITGGYFVSPLWSSGRTRKGKIHGEVVNIYSADEIANMSVEQVNDIIKTDLHEDAYATQSIEHNVYKGRNLAEHLEIMLYSCPKCNSLDTLYSTKNTVYCTKCSNKFTYDKYGLIDGIKQKTVKELFKYLRDKALDDAKNSVTYKSKDAQMITVKNHIESLVATGELSLSDTTLTCGDVNILIADILDISMHGKYALLLSTKDAYYEITVLEKTSALKFYMLFQAYKYGNIIKFTF